MRTIQKSSLRMCMRLRMIFSKGCFIQFYFLTKRKKFGLLRKYIFIQDILLFATTKLDLSISWEGVETLEVVKRKRLGNDHWMMMSRRRIWIIGEEVAFVCEFGMRLYINGYSWWMNIREEANRMFQCCPIIDWLHDRPKSWLFEAK